MSAAPKDREVHVFMLGAPLNIPPIEKPTVCLLACNASPSRAALAAIVDATVPAGCRYFMTWGSAADAMHDALDEILEDLGGSHLDVLTASHKDESAEDVAWFFLNAALPGETNTRCCVGYDEESSTVQDLLMAIRAVAADNAGRGTR